MYKLENYTLQKFLDNLVEELNRENVDREQTGIRQLDIPFIISTLYQSFKNNPDKYNEFIEDLVEWSDYFIVINDSHNTYNGIIDVDVILGKETSDADFDCTEYKYSNYRYMISFNINERLYGYCECTPDMPDYREDKHCCGHGCDAIFCEFDLDKVMHITSESWDGDEHDYWDFEEEFYASEEEIAERKLRIDRELAIEELKEKNAAEQKRLEKLEAELNATNK